MTWQYDQAHERILNLIGEAPTINVRRFSDQYMPLYEARKAELSAAREPVAPPLFDLPKGEAVLVNTVQIYIAITNYDDYRMDEGRETEASHERALRFLHLYYSACDRLIEDGPVQRVDFHGSRMHAVILDQSAAGVTPESIADAFAFIRDFRAVADRANRELANSEFDARFRIGIDAGPCVAINNGTGLEQEPMFLGSSANHAAKLADGPQPGIFISDRVRAILSLPVEGVLESVRNLDESYFDRMVGIRDEMLMADTATASAIRNPNLLLENWRGEIAAKDVPDPTVPRFSFHHQEPPLSEIKFADLSPSNSIRMPVASLFADLSGYTAYVDHAIANGGIADVVRALYVIRQEFQNVVEQDFGGRKVRFIGDCIHAVLAEGDRNETDEPKSVVQSFSCSGGLRSSFDICRDELGNLDSLGLAIGIELGPTPISRIGIRGERSVRIASSVATATSEQMQQDCQDNEVRFGPVAIGVMPAALEDLLQASSVNYDDVAACLSTHEQSPTAPAVHARAHSHNDGSVSRAHFRKA